MTPSTPNRLLSVITGIALLFCFSFGLCDAGAAEKTDTKGAQDADMAVKVNDVMLTHTELENQLKDQFSQLAQYMPQEKAKEMQDQIKKKIIEDFITRTLLSQEADKYNITVSDEETNAQIKEMEKNLPQGMTLETALQSSGVSLEKFRSDLAFGLRAKKLVDTHIKDYPLPTAEEKQQYYEANKEKFDEPEKIHARHILIKTSTKDDETIKAEKKIRIEELRKKIMAGASFEKIAQENSDCPSKARGGDLGTFARGKMVKAFEDAAFRQEVNEIGPVIETMYGYHIIQVLEHTRAVPKTFDEVTENIEQILAQQKKNAAIKDYVTALREKAAITYGTGDAPKEKSPTS